jgi:heme/copper-type cytochrome/quinol oxidase subunit 3
VSTRGQGTVGIVDVSDLPTYAYGHRSLVWWGTIGMIAIESTVFALAAFSYFYIRSRADEWPPTVDAPELLWGTLNFGIMLVSLIPNQWAKHVAEAEDRTKVRIGLTVCLAFGVALLVIRAFEFGALNCRWDTNAYASAVWMLLGLHTLHLLTDFYDSVVLTVLSYTGPWEGKRYVDVSENAMYWYFVVIAWIPVYAIVYLAPRFL